MQRKRCSPAEDALCVSESARPKGLFLDALAHGLWAAAAAMAAKRTAGFRVRILLFALWATFPDVLAFGPGVAVGLWLRLVGGAGYAESAHGGHFQHAHIGLPLYAMGVWSKNSSKP